MSMDVRAITEKVQAESQFIGGLLREIDKVMVGQRYMLERLLIGLLSDGHVLVEGVPGLAKTTAVKTLSQSIRTQFKRIQFTPDLLPADLIGTQIYQPRTSEFTTKKGPVFTNILLADEINRAPAKVQSALLEAMQEKQVSIAEDTFKLPSPFLVLATQNPIEQEGTYPLPEAQVDRFMLKLKVDYPSKAEELDIMRRVAGGQVPEVNGVVGPEDILHAREVVNSIYMDEKIESYIVDVVFATRDPKAFGLGELSGLIQYGVSPRASIYLNRAARAHAFLRGRGFVTPQDVKTMGFDVLRHRLILTYEAEAEEMTTDDVIQKIFDRIEVP